jgi:regulator of sigma E protease
MNFLPIPVVDGGLFTFLIIEKIKGSPISPRVQAAAQVAGLVILLSVFLFATYQDVYRLPLLMH